MVQQISLMEAYLIESLRSNNITNDEILQKVRNNNVNELEGDHEKFDYTNLYGLEEANILEEVLTNGYKVKFLTINGLINLLNMKFNKVKDEHYKMDHYAIVELQLTEQEKEQIEQLLSVNWKIKQTATGIVIKSKHE